MINENIGVSQGWQCPICKRIYSPMTPMCYHCGGEQKTMTYTTSTKNYIEIPEMNKQIAEMNKHAPIHPQQQIGG